MRNEIRIMRHLYHRNVVLLFEVINDPSEDSIFMIMEVGRPPPLLPF
jgi:serine/threonine protein kinase